MLTSALKAAYTQGDCWALAQELRRLTGWQVWVVAQRQGDSADPHPDHWSHMLVRTPQGEFLDIEGVRSASDLLSLYAVAGQESFLAPVPAGRLARFVSRQSRFYPSMALTPTALRLLAEYRGS